MSNLEYDPEREPEIEESLPEDLQRRADTHFDVWQKALMFDLFKEADRVFSAYPDFRDHFVRKFSQKLNIVATAIVNDYIETLNSRAELTKETALKTLLSQHYPIEIRSKMLAHFDAGDYNKVAELALTHDGPLRGRPNKGKTGPEDPLSIGSELHHLNLDGFIKRICNAEDNEK